MTPPETNNEDWNAMPQWMKDMVTRQVYVGAYVQMKYPEIYAEAMEAKEAGQQH
jgi:hypothetical protein